MAYQISHIARDYHITQSTTTIPDLQGVHKFAKKKLWEKSWSTYTSYYKRLFVHKAGEKAGLLCKYT